MQKSLSRKPVYVIAAVFAAFAFVAGAIILTAETDYETRRAFLEMPVIQHFKHTYNSMRKLPDLLFVPYLFTKSNIPTYELSIKLDNIIRMNNALPDKPISGALGEDNKLYVRADFKDKTTGYDDRVKIKYRGLVANHWNSLQKSYRIQFPSENFWRGRRLVNFVIPYDRAYYVEPLNMYRAKKFGLLDLPMEFARLNLNGTDAGVYLVFEQWSPELLAKKSLPESKMFGLADGEIYYAKSADDYINMFDKEGDTAKEELKALLELRNNAPDELFKKLIPQILDMEKFYRWNILNILAGSNHQSEEANAILYFNNATGKFELVPWDINIYDNSNGSYNDAVSPLINRILSIAEFRERRNALLRSYVKNPKNLADDLAFYDNLVEKTNSDFLKDNSKLHTNLKYLSLVKEYRKWVAGNFDAAMKLLSRPDIYSGYKSRGRYPVFEGSFERFADLVLNVDQFVSRNPQFYKIDDYSVGLSGTTVFNDDVVIPAGISLTIAPGSVLFMDSAVSIIVNGSVNAYGTASAPILIKKISNKPWGAFAVLNAKKPSKFTYVEASGGSGEIFNGVKITGMVAFHNSDVSINNSSFADSGDDDALNVKLSKTNIRNSNFGNTASDAIDIDFPKKESSVSGNFFADIGGDAIDLSFSDIEISNNKIQKCGDKGISVGEVSHPKIRGNIIKECVIGVAVKDLSEASIFGNTFSKNVTGVSLYRKKPEFGGAKATIGENVFSGNEKDLETDSLSTIIHEN